VTGGLLTRPKFCSPRWVTEPALLDVTISQVLDDLCEKQGARPFVTFVETGDAFTFASLRKQSDDIARGFLALGIGRGDRIGIWSPNRPEWVLTQFAAARIGAILVNINPSYRIYELDHALNLVGCKAIVIAEALKSTNYPELIQSLIPELPTSQPAKLRSRAVRRSR